MSANPAQPLIDLQPAHEFFIGIDSDGCAFDTMEIKHKECFIPNFIKYFGLQSVAKYAREAAEFVNLYSEWRGANRFPAYLKAVDLLAERKEAKARGFVPPRLDALRAWIGMEPKPGNPSLIRALSAAEGDDADTLQMVLEWSEAVNRSVTDIVYGVAPFPLVRESLQKARKMADMVVVSATPTEALEREWAEHNLAQYVQMIAGQEMGKKDECLGYSARDRYPSEKILMIGDAPGDLKAARANNALFYPIKPLAEEESWQRFHDEALDRFFSGTYQGEYEQKLIEEFLVLLPSTPHWK